VTHLNPPSQTFPLDDFSFKLCGSIHGYPSILSSIIPDLRTNMPIGSAILQQVDYGGGKADVAHWHEGALGGHGWGISLPSPSHSGD
jgi:hypothetical protein